MMQLSRSARHLIDAHARELFRELEPRTMFSTGFVSAGDAPGFAGETVTADFDGDGDLDAATMSATPTFTRLDILRNDGTGELTQWQHFNYPRADGHPMNVDATDFDADGDVDIIAFGFRLFRNNDGTFGAAELLSNQDIDGDRFFADHNGDGLPDAFVQEEGSGNVTLHINAGGATLGNGAAVPGPGGGTLSAVTDMDGDGDIDLVYTSTTADVYLNSNGTYSAGPSFNAGFVSAPVVRDINGDNRPDLVWANNRLYAALNNGNGAFTGAGASGGTNWDSVNAVGDINADGILDIVGVRINGLSRAVSAAFGTQAGQFDTPFNDAYSFQSAAELDPLVYTAEMTGDSRDDLLLVRRFAISPLSGFMTVYRSAFGGPQVTSFEGPEGPYMPGREITLTVTTAPGKAGAVNAVRIYVDTNENDVFDNADQLLGDAVAGQTANAWTFTRRVTDEDSGVSRFFAVATDVGDVSSGAATFAADIWTRVAYPEGWRNDATINEYVPMVNPNTFEVQFRLVAHYETGERDVVIAQGVIPPMTRGGVTISEWQNPAGAIVALNQGYALELQSSAYLGATLSHYDSFTDGSGAGAATGEAFTNDASTTWYFADASTLNASFLVFFNPNDVAAEVTITFHDQQGGTTSFPWYIEPLRRSGIDIRHPDVQLGQGSYGVVVTASSEIIAALSSYSTTEQAGFTALGRTLEPAGDSAFPLIEFRDNADNDMTLFNFNANAQSNATLHISYPGSNEPAVTRNFTLNALERHVIDLNEFRVNGATSISVRLESTDIRGHIEAIDLVRGDSVSAAPGARTADLWSFADGFLDRNTAGTVGFETLALYNPGGQDTGVQISYLHTDGSVFTRNVTVAANSTYRHMLDQDTDLLAHSQLIFYSVVVTSDTPIVSMMIHWDLFQGGGWSTLGTPGVAVQQDV